MNHNLNIDNSEVEKFSSLAAQWWQLDGLCAPLHHLNPTRLQFIMQHCKLQSKSVLDVGCGAGILSESLALQGAIVTGLDASIEVIAAAKEHAAYNQLDIEYIAGSTAEFSITPTKLYDVITCMELLEHVPDPALLIKNCFSLLKPGGHLFLSTLNRTPKSYLFAVVAAEYILKLLPKQTHDYNKFIRPSELAEIFRDSQFNLQELSGIEYNPFTKTAKLCADVNVNYLAYATRQ